MILATVIRVIHILLVLFLIFTPILSNNFHLLLLHFILVPGIIIHWILNNNTCSLTVIESVLRQEPDTSKTLMGKLLNPIFDYDNGTAPTYLLLSLWAVTIYRLRKMPEFYLFWKEFFSFFNIRK